MSDAEREAIGPVMIFRMAYAIILTVIGGPAR